MGENALVPCGGSIPATHPMLWSPLMGKGSCVFGARKTQTHRNWHKSAFGMNFEQLWCGDDAGHPGGMHMRSARRQLLSWDKLKTYLPHPNTFD